MMDGGSTFIQWKGTDLCMDLHCPKCGEHSHFDGMFAYAVRCGSCGQDWKMPEDVASLLVPLDAGHDEPVLTDIDT
jgi:uncharacterized protein (DUF983 family)